MITKEQALTCTSFVQVYITSEYGAILKCTDGSPAYIRATKQLKWRANGKCKTWKRASNSHKFKLPIKHGLYSFGYINEENCHLFEAVV